MRVFSVYRGWNFVYWSRFHRNNYYIGLNLGLRQKIPLSVYWQLACSSGLFHYYMGLGMFGFRLVLRMANSATRMSLNVSLAVPLSTSDKPSLGLRWSLVPRRQFPSCQIKQFHCSLTSRYGSIYPTSHVCLFTHALRVDMSSQHLNLLSWMGLSYNPTSLIHSSSNPWIQ